MREILFVSDEARLKALEKKIDELTILVTKLLNEKQSIGDWVSEEQAVKLSGLCKSKLYELRNKGKVRSSSLTERKIFYRRSDFEKLLEANQK